MKGSDLRLLLDELGTTAKKGLSQNFLIDGNILRKILKTASIQPGDQVLEIGAGPGALTQCLLEAGASVTAVEIDPIFAKALNRLQTSPPRLHIIAQDVLKVSLDELLLSHPWKVVANLPYHITTPILTKLLPLYPRIKSVTAMVQKEVAFRLVAAPRTPEYGSLTLFAHFYSTPHHSFTVAPTCFYPQPKVDSSIVHFELKKPPQNISQEEFFELTRTSFQQRRKMLRVSLKALHAPQVVEAALTAIGISPLARPEELSMEQFLQFYGQLYRT